MPRATARRRICVFCGSSAGVDPRYLAAAADTGRFLAARQIGVVYGGGRDGMMGAVADAALAAGGEVIGVIPRGLVAREIAHEHLRELIVVDTMHERKASMAERAGAFLTLPGGFGTLEEIFEAITWRQLGIHDKPCGFLNVAGFFDDLIAHFDRAAREGFVRPRDRAGVICAADLATVVDELLRPHPFTGR